jgi:MFS family permease
MTTAFAPDSRYAWFRLGISLVLAIVGGIGLWLAVVVIPTIQQEFGIDRAGASLPYTVTFIGFALGGFTMGKVADRFGIIVPVSIAAVALGAGFVLAALSQTYWQLLVVQAVMIGFAGSAATFGPLVADVSQWFLRRRGIAVAIVASGNYIAGTIWPPFMQSAIATYGWRATYIAIGIICVVVIPCSIRRWCLRDWPAASPCRCRRSISWPIAPTWATDLRAAPRCCR